MDSHPEVNDPDAPASYLITNPEGELERMRWYLEEGGCPEEHKASIRNAIGQLMDGIAKRKQKK